MLYRVANAGLVVFIRSLLLNFAIKSPPDGNRCLRSRCRDVMTPARLDSSALRSSVAFTDRRHAWPALKPSRSSQTRRLEPGLLAPSSATQLLTWIPSCGSCNGPSPALCSSSIPMPVEHDANLLSITTAGNDRMPSDLARPAILASFISLTITSWDAHAAWCTI